MAKSFVMPNLVQFVHWHSNKQGSNTFITPPTKDFFMTTSKFVTFEGEERTFEEQVVYLSQTLRALEQTLRDQQEILDSIQNRLYYIEATGLNNTN